MSRRQPLSESQEDYLEAIYRIAGRQGKVRPLDIAKALEVTGASVTGALHSLSDEGLINHKPYGAVVLTRAGRRIARGVVRRHETLRRFLHDVLQVRADTAERCACRMEHAMPDEVLDRFVRFVDQYRVSQDGCLMSGSLNHGTE